MSDKQFAATLSLLHGEVGDYVRSGEKLPTKISEHDKSLRKEAGTKCNKHIWDQDDKSCECPRAGCNGRRYDDRVCLFICV